mgnify:CR=1 FL=1
MKIKNKEFIKAVRYASGSEYFKRLPPHKFRIKVNRNCPGCHKRLKYPFGFISYSNKIPVERTWRHMGCVDR